MAVIVFFILFLIIEALLLALSLGIGYALRWLIPSLDLGMATLIGLVSSITTFYLISKINRETKDEPVYVIDDEEEDEDDEQSTRQGRLRQNLYSFDQFSGRKRRRRKK
jgi:hypothetical protein